jgi:hypothetical protein
MLPLLNTQLVVQDNGEKEALTPKTTPNAHMYCTKKPRASH